MENEVNASHIKIEVEEMSPIKCYNTKYGCPIYPIWDEEEDENLYELDNFGCTEYSKYGGEVQWSY
jgi:hypothetical protein